MTPSPRSADAALDPDVGELASRLRLSVTRLARRLRQEAGDGHTPSQLSALAVIANRGPMTLGQVAEHERVAPPSITKVVTKLEAEGLVTRSPDPTDGRVTHVSATAAGRALIEEYRRRRTTWLAARLQALPPADQARLADALTALDALWQEERS